MPAKKICEINPDKSRNRSAVTYFTTSTGYGCDLERRDYTKGGWSWDLNSKENDFAPKSDLKGAALATFLCSSMSTRQGDVVRALLEQVSGGGCLHWAIHGHGNVSDDWIRLRDVLRPEAEDFSEFS